MLSLKIFHNAGHCLMGLAVFLQVHTLPAASPLLLPGQNGLKEPAGTDKVNVTTSSWPYFEIKHGLNRFQSVVEFIQFMKPHLNEKQAITLLFQNI